MGTRAKDKLQIKDIDTKKIIEDAGYKKWKVYAKSPFGSVASVVEYLGRYTHKIAITIHRIINITENGVSFKYTGYADRDEQKGMTVNITEFLRRFELHILPGRFCKNPSLWIIAKSWKNNAVKCYRQQLNLGPLVGKVQVT